MFLGDMSWIMRIQNQISTQHSMYDFPLNELSTLFMPTIHQMSSEIENESHSLELEQREEEELNPSSYPISIPSNFS